MLRSYLVGLGLVLACGWGVAEAQPPDTQLLQDYAQTRGFQLGRPQRPRFTPDARTVLFLRSGAHSKVQNLYELDLASGQTRELVSAEQLLSGGGEALSAEEKARRERQRLQAAGFANYHLSPDGKQILLSLSGKFYLFDRARGQLKALGFGGLDPQWAPDSRKFAYVRDYDLWVYAPGRGEQPVTRGGSQELTHGLAEFVAQEEMRRDHGFWWSPDSRELAYEEADHKGVEIWNISDPAHPEKPPFRQYYPRPGRPNVKVRLGIVSASGGPSKWVQWSPRQYEYLAAVHWDKQGPLTIQLQDRAQQKLALMRVEPRSGATRTILELADPAWVNLHQEVPVWLPGAKQFLFLLPEHGYENLYLVDAQGKSRTCVVPPGGRTDQSYDITEFEGYDPKRRVIYCRVEESPPGNPQLLEVALDAEGNPGEARLSGQGVTDLEFARGHDLKLVTSTTLEQFPLTRVEGEASHTLPEVSEEPLLTLNYTAEPIRDEAGRLLLNAALIRPRDFVAGKRYPVILDVYGGPRHLHVVNARKNYVVDQWLADQGFIVVVIDNHGTPGRGLEFEKAVYGKFATLPLEDQVFGLKALGQRHPELDLERVGAVGWSFGGYLAAQSVLARPDIFKAAVAGAPVTDWKDYDTHYTERYLGVPPAAEQAYDDSDLLKLAPGLSRPLLLVHGTADDNVYYRHGLRLCDALLRADREFEALPLPGITHSYTADATVTERLWSRVRRFFKRHLGEPE